MPVSQPNPIPYVCKAVNKIKPKSILDVGIGFGVYGYLFRDYVDVCKTMNSSRESQIDIKNWSTKIDGIEVCNGFITDIHRLIYNNIYIGDAKDVIKKLGNYDFIFLGDVLEHFEKDEGRRFLNEVYERANIMVIIITPSSFFEQEDYFNNPYSIHRSFWGRDDFKMFSYRQIFVIDKGIRFIALFKRKEAVFDIRKLMYPRTPPLSHRYVRYLKIIIVLIFGRRFGERIIDFLRNFIGKDNQLDIRVI